MILYDSINDMLLNKLDLESYLIWSVDLTCIVDIEHYLTDITEI